MRLSLRRILPFVAIMILASCLLLGPAEAVPGAKDVAAGNEQFQKGQFEDALASYGTAAAKNPSEAAIDYNLGAAYYKKGDYERAVGSFQKSLLTDDDLLRRNVYFNLGNAFYKNGIARENDDIASAIAGLEKSIEHYGKLLTAKSDDEDAAANRQFVQGELERLRKKQEEKKQNPSQSQSQEQKKSDEQKKQEQQKDQSSQDQASSQDNSSSSGQEQQQGQEKSGESPQSQTEDPSKDPSKSEEEQAKDQDGDSSDSSDKKSDQSPQDQKKPSDGDEEKKGPEGQDQQKSSASGQPGAGQVLSQEEARGLLDEFDQNDQPKGLLNFIREKKDERPVEKDW